MKTLIPILIIIVMVLTGCPEIDKGSETTDHATTDQYSATIATSLDGHVEVVIKFNTQEEYYKAWKLYKDSIDEFQQNIDVVYLSQFPANGFEQLEDADFVQFTDDEMPLVLSLSDFKGGE